MELRGDTVVYAVLGHPVAHSRSPAMHNPALQALGLNAVYAAFDCRPERLSEAFQGLAALGVAGVNLTIPLKEEAFRLCASRDREAELPGAVNTVRFDDDGPIGTNTDGYGLERAIEEAFGLSFEGARVAVIGTGGAGRAAALAAAERGASGIVLLNRGVERARRVAEEIRARVEAPVTVAKERPAWPRLVREADIVVHATSVGLRPGDAPLLGAEAFREGQALLDMVYVSPRTALMAEAAAAGARVANGLGMLLHQGARSLEWWTGRPAPLEVMRRALEGEVYGEDKR